jgi:uncharacterized protein
MLKPEHKICKVVLDYPEPVRRTIQDIISGYQPDEIWVFGSYARGDRHIESDLDLLIIKETDRRFADRIEDVLQYSQPGLVLEPLIYTCRERDGLVAGNNPFVKEVLAEGKLVYG